MPGFNLTYRDYLAENSAGSEANTLLTEEQWNALSQSEKEGLVNFQNLGVTIGANDPRYAELSRGVNPEQGRTIGIHAGTFDPAHNVDRFGNQVVKDPSRVVQHDGYWVSSDDNQTPEAQAAADDGLSDWQWALMVLAGMAGGAAIGGLGAGAAAPAMTTSVGGGFGTGALGAGGTGASFGGAFSAADALGSLTAGGEPMLPEPGASGGLGDGGGLDPETWDLNSGTLHGGDNLYGTEIPNEYTPGADPTNYYEPLTPYDGEMPPVQGTETGSWIDRILGRLPGIASALGRGVGAGSRPGGGGGGGGGAGSFASAGGGMGGPKGGHIDLATNPYAAGKLTPVMSLQQYLRGG